MNRLWGCFFLLVYGAALQAEGVPFYSSIPVEFETKEILPFSETIRLEMELSTHSDKLLTAWTGVENLYIEQSEDQTIEISLDLDATLSGMPLDKHLSPSFVIDYDESSSQEFIEKFHHSGKKEEILSEIAKYVDSYIEDPTYVHNFNIASKVASDRSGDCSEYAVLTTALSRSLGMPARLVMGTVMFEEANTPLAFGHAWTEVWDNGRWQILDAALYEYRDKQLRYIPAAEMDNEGYSYMFSIVRIVSLFPTKINILSE